MNNLSALLGVTMHLIDDLWNRKMAVIQLKQMETRHKGELIAEELICMMKDWNINESQRGVLVHDNASSMVKAA